MISIEHIKQNYSKEVALLLICCRVFLKTAKSSELVLFIEQHQPDLQAVYELAKIHRIRPVVYETLAAADSLSPQLKDQLKQFLLNHSLRSFQCHQKAASMVSLMQQHSIAIQLYKGTHLSQLLYNHLTIREFGDIDFMVRKEDIPRLITVLKETGYQIEGDELLMKSQDDYLSHQRDVICYETTPAGTFLYEFHYKPIGSYLAMDISFGDMLPPNWQIGKEFSACDYLPLITTNHGLVDLYPTLRCMMDIAMLLQQCSESRHYRLCQQLGGYYALNMYIVQQLLNVKTSDLPFPTNSSRTVWLGQKIIRRMLTRKGSERIPTSAIWGTSFLLRAGVHNKLKLLRALINYILTPNYNDAPESRFKYKWLHTISRPIRLFQNAKRHI